MHHQQRISDHFRFLIKYTFEAFKYLFVLPLLLLLCLVYQEVLHDSAITIFCQEINNTKPKHAKYNTMINILQNGLTIRNSFTVSSAEDIKHILEKEGISVNYTHGLAPDHLQRITNTYSLTYTFVYKFQRRNILIFLSLGCHMGACQHHGIIPFGEKDVGFAFFHWIMIKSCLQWRISLQAIISMTRSATGAFDIKYF